MAKISTHNKRRARALRAKVLAEAAAYHYDRCVRLQAKGRLDDLRDSNYNRRWKRRNKAVSRKYKMRVLGTVTGRFSSTDPVFKEIPRGQSITGRMSSNPDLSVPAMDTADYLLHMDFTEVEKRLAARDAKEWAKFNRGVPTDVDGIPNHAAASWP